MPSLVLDDFFGDTTIELQLSHISTVDDKNTSMINKVFCEIVNLKKENKKLKEEIKQLRNPDAGKNRLQVAFDEIKRLETQIGVLQRMNKRLRKNKP